MPISAEHRRAKVGGERGANGEWYRGGSFIATRDNPKSHTPYKKATQKQEYENRKWCVPPVVDTHTLPVALYPQLGGIEILSPDGTYRLNEKLSADYSTKEALLERKKKIVAWNLGARWRLVDISADGTRKVLDDFLDTEGCFIRIPKITD